MRKAVRHAFAFLALLLLLPGLTLPATAAIKAPGVSIIRNDPGGSVASRLRQIEKLRSDGTRVEIRGTCASACTLFLGLPNTCVARSSRLSFHGPQSQYYGVALPPQEFEYWSQVMADHYPGPIRLWFLAKARNTTMEVLTITGAEAIRMGARPCN